MTPRRAKCFPWSSNAITISNQQRTGEEASMSVAVTMLREDALYWANKLIYLYVSVCGTWTVLVIHCWCVCRDNSLVVENQPQPAKRTDSIKTFIRNIGLPAPPVIGRKISAPPTAPISSSVATSGSSTTVGTLPAIPSSPVHRTFDAASSGTSTSSTTTPRHSVS